MIYMMEPVTCLAGCAGEAGVPGDPIRAAHCEPRQPQAPAAGGQVWQVCSTLP